MSSDASSWTEDDEYVESPKIRFDLPANDNELVEQVFEFLNDNQGINPSEVLVKLARKYRFAGYIGSIEFLFAWNVELENELDKMRDRIEALEKREEPPPKSWWTWF